MKLKLQILSPLFYALKRQEKGNCSPQIQNEDKLYLKKISIHGLLTKNYHEYLLHNKLRRTDKYHNFMTSFD